MLNTFVNSESVTTVGPTTANSMTGAPKMTKNGGIHACAVRNMTCHVFPSKLNCTGVGVGYCGSKKIFLKFETCADDLECRICREETMNNACCCVSGHAAILAMIFSPQECHKMDFIYSFQLATFFIHMYNTLVLMTIKK